MSRLKELIHEIHRRSLWQVLLIYVGGSWAVLAVVDTLAGALGLPDWAPRFALFLLIIGLPVVLATAFVQEGVSSAPGSSGTASTSPATLEASVTSDEIASMGSRAATRSSTRGRLGRLLTWRNAIGGGITALALWGAVAAGWLLLEGRSSTRGISPDSDVSFGRIAVFPFQITGDEELQYLREGMVKLLGTRLDGAAGLTLVDPNALLARLRSEPEAVTGDPALARNVAERLGAGRFVLGEVMGIEGTVRLTASVYGLDGSRGPVATAEVRGPPARILSHVDELASQLLGRLASGAAQRLSRIAGVTTASLPALRAYLEGEAAYRAGRYQFAYDAFERAVSEDSAFALAHYRVSVVAGWASGVQWAVAVEAAERAIRLAERLSPRDRRLLEAVLAFRQGEWAEALEGFSRIVTAYPDDVEARSYDADVQFHFNPLRGLSVAESRAGFESVRALDPLGDASLVHLARIAAVEGDLEELDRVVGEFHERYPRHDRALEMNTLRAVAGGEPEALDRIHEKLERAPSASSRSALHTTLVYCDNPFEAGALIRRVMTSQHRPLPVRREAIEWEAFLEAATGRWKAAWEALDRLGALAPERAVELRTFLATSPLSPVTREDGLEALRRGLEDLGSAHPDSARTAVEARMSGIIRTYLLGIVEARLGDRGRAAVRASRLEQLAGPREARSLPQDLAHGIRAQIAMLNDDAEEALRHLEQLAFTLWLPSINSSPLLSQVHSRFLHAEALYRLGRYDGALRRFASLTQTTPGEAVYTPISRLRQAEIHDARGEESRAADLYRAFLELWKDADPELQPRVRAAQKRLEEILAARG